MTPGVMNQSPGGQDPDWQLLIEINFPRTAIVGDDPAFERLAEKINRLGMCPLQLERLKKEVVQSIQRGMDSDGPAQPAPVIRVRLLIQKRIEAAAGDLDDRVRGVDRGTEPQRSTAGQEDHEQIGNGCGYFLTERAIDSSVTGRIARGSLIEIFIYQEGR